MCKNEGFLKPSLFQICQICLILTKIALKGSIDDYPFYFLVRGKGKIESFGDPIPLNDYKGNKHYHQGEGPEEKFIPSKLENPSKRGHGIPFSPSAQMALNVGRKFTCTECHKSKLKDRDKMETKHKDGELRSFSVC